MRSRHLLRIRCAIADLARPHSPANMGLPLAHRSLPATASLPHSQGARNKKHKTARPAVAEPPTRPSETVRLVDVEATDAVGVERDHFAELLRMREQVGCKLGTLPFAGRPAELECAVISAQTRLLIRVRVQEGTPAFRSSLRVEECHPCSEKLYLDVRHNDANLQVD